MSKTTTARGRRVLASLAAAALVLTGGVTFLAAPAAAAERSVALVGSLQNELGCADDWLPDCAATELAQTEADPNLYSAEFDVPAGTYNYKVALDDKWDENYGADGVKGGGDIPLTVGGPSTLRFTYDDTSHLIGIEVVSIRQGYSADDDALVAAPVRQPGDGEQFYFVMTDRFANGDPSNDQGGLSGDRLSTGFDPTSTGFYNGGDIAGLRANLDYIEGLGTSAIWLTPSFKNKPVQGTGDNVSAGYHGYWITDFTQIDPHLGTNEELEAFIDDANARGIKVYFDIITNHTADVIDYAEGQYSYIPKGTEPYRDENGNVFDPDDYAGTDTFPALDPATSFPYTPVIADAEKDVKVPAWLNDPTLYHNRGDSTWSGESVTYGDFIGLDDLMTEHPTVVDGFIDVYQSWIDLGIDGFRIDTAKHVNFEFWEKWSSEVLDYAYDQGKTEFFMFGEVFDADPSKLAPYVRDSDMNSVLDFAFQSRAQAFVRGGAAKDLGALYAEDDRYTTPTSSATALPTFVGNHDMGRIGFLLDGRDQKLERSLLAHDLMFLGRGQPVVYYGDEQGFAGNGGDRAARQTLFASQVPEYVDQTLITGETAGSQDRYATDAPVYEHIAGLAQLRADHPTLVDGAQIERYAAAGAGVYAFSRVDRDDKVEYLVAVNNATTAQTVSLTTLTAGATLTPVYGGGDAVTTDAAAAASVTVPALSARVYKADRPVSAPAAAAPIEVQAPAEGAGLSGSVAVTADADESWRETSFAWRVAGSDEWNALGTAEDTTPGVFHDIRGLEPGTLVEYRAVSTDAAGNRSADSTYASVGNKVDLTVPPEEPEEPEQPVEPEPQDGPTEPYEAVSVPGSFNSEVGCPGDWQPGCDGIQMTKQAGDVWSLKIANLPASETPYEYKIAVNRSWDENYGPEGVPGSPNNITFEWKTGGEIEFFFNERTKYAYTTANGPVITLPGSLQSELGCTGGANNGDWLPDCLATMMFDKNFDGVYQFTTDDLPTGSYEVKVAHNRSWDENYGVGGARNGGNIAFSATAGKVTTFRYDIETHILTVTSEDPPLAGTGQLAAHWIDADTIAVPNEGFGTTADSTWELYSSQTAALVLTPEREVTGGDGEPIELTRVDGGLTAEQKARFPALSSYLALRVEGQDREDVAELLRGQLMVAQRNAAGGLTAFTGVQIPGVLDDLYADAVADLDLGVTFAKNNKPTFRLWAPTAQSAALLTWAPDATDPVRHEATWDAASGTWTVVGGNAGLKGDEYLWEVVVYAPTETSIVTNQVTDPYSVALTENSERSVAIDLSDKKWKPKQWEKTAAPVVDRPVDRAIYELHIRDFSATDESVPEDLRGTYLAFTQKSAGTTQLKQLADAGINTVHLLPSFDIASIEEDPAAQLEPACDLASLPADSEQQQVCVDAVADQDAFNWGYDPYHYSVPEGSYATNPEGGARVGEFRSMVGALHGLGLQVVLDEVYNHTAQSGQDEKSVLDKVVPGYYHRLNATGGVETSTCCQNIATEHEVAEKLMVDSVVTWARDYKVDGFRFDLMGHHSKDNMLAIRDALDELTLKKDGVDGEAIYLYGEGWNFGEVQNDRLFEQARQGNLGGTGIGTFNDRLRDGVHGGSPVVDSTFEQGFGTGLETDPNGKPVRPDARNLDQQTDLVKIGLAGNLRDFEFTAADGTVKSGEEIDYGGAGAGYADQPDEVINYVDAHDNHTLYDLGVLKLPTDTSMADRIRMNTLSLATVTLSQSPSFWHAGTELLRSKSLDDNSYNSGDWFNRIDWTGQESTFGSGLPRAADNADKWDVYRPLLADPALKPGASDIAAAEASALDLLRVRNEVGLLRLGKAELIEQKVSFPSSGTDATPGVIVMLIDDLLGKDVDPALKGALVVFNASPDATTQTIPALAGRGFALTPALAKGTDAVVKTTTWNATTGAVTVPARSVAVLVEKQPLKTSIVAAPSKLVASAGTPVKVVGKVVSDGAPEGTVTVTDGGKVIATAPLAAAAKGKFDIALPSLGRGIHLLRVSFTGAAGWADSRFAVPLPVLIH
ncbi:pullulanase-type alpha-1,6-glucosidase [Microbacterium sp. BK668]|uniref:pullulanase-type alpha-1,6-glucosidase n=1 Tax=Microbacterium sp. BK668 TaxID=2512118 RepID=UPI00105F6380|nr:pullulanase-type alpha-1,6-glucosidase [Microbacterium sp. BK668]TDN91387.1 pullulanase-type alpha-1,6-glucosidase [Microbacterium sp. BK668]